jgi:Fur family transcriptional regulator, ferric uptake regulator
VEIEGPDVESWAERVADEHGFSDVSHTVEIFGLCRDCDTASDVSHNESSGSTASG